MSTGRYLSLEEARKKGLLKQFAKEHDAEGDEAAFNRLLNAMAWGKKPEAGGTSDRDDPED